MDVRSLKIGQGFRAGDNRYGLIMNVDDMDVMYVDVKPISENNIMHRCYNDKNAEWPGDKDNVRLKDCPPPFRAYSFKSSDGKDVTNAYAVADMANLKRMPIHMFEFDICEVIDNGAVISRRDLEIIKKHPWPFQIEKEKDYERRPGADSMKNAGSSVFADLMKAAGTETRHVFDVLDKKSGGSDGPDI